MRVWHPRAPALRAAKISSFTVARGPVPRRAPVYRIIAGDRPPHYGNRTVSWLNERPPIIVGRGPVPRHAAVYQMIAGDRPPRYGNRTVSEPKNGPLHRRARACPSPCRGLPNARGGQAPALREHRDREVSPTGTSLASRPGGLCYRDASAFSLRFLQMLDEFAAQL